jgi:hypothetical protein
MLTLNEVKTVEVGKVTAGNLVIVKDPSSGLPRLAIGAYGIDQVPERIPLVALVYLDPGKPPEVAPLQSHRARCVNLGPAVARVAPTVGSFSLDHRFSTAGNLLIDDAGVRIICKDASGGDEQYVHVPTG